MPLLYLTQQSFKRGLLANFDMALWRDAFNSVAFATLATLFALLLGFATILAKRWRPNALRSAAMNIAQTGYALPGLVLALGLLTPLLAIDNVLNALAGWLGTVAAGTDHGRFGRCRGHRLYDPLHGGADRTDQGRASSGFRATMTTAPARPAQGKHHVRQIHLPLLRPAMWGAAILVFVDCLKELPATLLLRPLNVETLATSIYQFASRGSFEEGALAALLIVAASIGPVVWLTRFADMPNGPA